MQNLSKNKNVFIQESDKGKSVAIVNEAYHLDEMKKLLNESNKSGILNFAINQKNVLKIFSEILAASNSISEETKRSLKPVGTRPGIIYELDKFHEDIENCPPF